MSILTIGMPVFNDKDFLEKSLNSILSQSFKDFVLIISDDGSTDGCELICKKYAEKDPRIQYIRQEKNIGISKNMKFLLQQSKSRYFMWAGDDDLYAPNFIESLIKELQINDAVCAFCNFSTIDENDAIIETHSEYNYAEWVTKKRLVNFIKNSHDKFGYGIFKMELILEVEFPTWWWPNSKTPYNNIYPSLCFYLAKGNYLHISGDPLFFKREKTGGNVHHKIPGANNAIKESLAYWIRRFNLVVFSARMIRKGGNVWLMFYTLPFLFYFWFLVPSFKQLSLAGRSLFNKKRSK